MMVLADADLERAANGRRGPARTPANPVAAWRGFMSSARLPPEFVRLLADKTRKMRHGIDTDFEIEMVFMSTQNQLKVVERHVQDALDKGATIEASNLPPRPDPGYFHPGNAADQRQ